MTNVTTIEKELSKLTKVDLAELCEKLDVQPHAKKAVMVNRLRLQKEEGNLETPFDEPAFDPEIELASQPKEKKVKAPKEPKPVPVYDWTDSIYEGRQVYTSAGTGRIISECITSAKGEPLEGHYLISRKDGQERAVNAATTRFKAVNDLYRDRMIKEETVRTESGSPCIHSGTLVSRALKGAIRAEVGSVYMENDLADLYEEKIASGRNNGMCRMDLGNILMGRIRKGETVSIFGQTDMELAAETGDARALKEAAEAAERRKDSIAARLEEKAAKLEAKEKAKAEKAAAAEAKKTEKAEKNPSKKAVAKAKRAKKKELLENVA